MRVWLELVGFPGLRERLGDGPAEIEFDGRTLADLLRWLQATHGAPAEVQILGPAGQLDPDIVVLRDGRQPIPADALEQELSEGERLSLIVVVAGG